ncbi:MAG: hypothetical protein JWM53_5860, partial [bacterium]|nr:hypothetical protein [bacterium]
MYTYTTERATVVTAANIDKIMRAKDAIAALTAKTGAITFD